MSIGQMQAIMARLDELDKRIAELERQRSLQAQLPAYQIEPIKRGPGRPKGSTNGL